MGFFSVLKDIVAEQVDKYDAQTQEQKDEAINKLQSEKCIVNNVPISKVINDAHLFPGIEFGNSHVSENVYDTFHIPNEETIVACVKGKIKNFGSVVEKIVLTNIAIYFLPELCAGDNLSAEENSDVEKGKNCILITDLCKYIIFSTKSYNSIQLLGPYGIKTILKKPKVTAILSKNTIEESFCSLILFIQKEVYEDRLEARQDRNHVFDWLAKKTMDETLDGSMDNQTKSLIYSLKNENDFSQKCVLLLMNQLAITLKEKELLQIVSEEKISIQKYQENDFLDQFEKGLADFLNQVLDVECEFKDKFLSKLDINKGFLKNMENDQPMECEELEKLVDAVYRKYKHKFELYLGVRKYSNIEESEIRNYFHEIGVSDYKTKEILRFVFLIRNKKMQRVYHSLKNNTELDKKYLDCVDSCGLTPLHYGIIIGNDEKCQYIIKNMSKLTSFYNGLDEELLDRYDYGTLCTLLGKEELLDQVIRKSPDIEALQMVKAKIKVSLKARELKLKFYERSIEAADRQYREAKRSHEYCEEQLNEYLEKLREAKSEKRNLQEEIRELENEILEVEDEISEITSYLQSKYYEIANKIKKGETVADRLFALLYSSPEIIEKLIFSQNNEYEFEFVHNRLFFICKDILNEIYSDTKEDFYDDSVKSEPVNDDNSCEKLHGDSWFSEKAHHDIKVLIKEYRELAKKYHPDVNPKHEKIFTEINVERAEILEMLK